MTATRTWDFMRSYSAFPVMLNRLSLPGLIRQSILFARRWMRGSSPRMTVESSGSIPPESTVVRYLRLSAAMILVAALSGTSALAQGPVKVKIRLDWKAGAQHAPFYLGKQRGYYTDEGLDLDIISGTGSPPHANTVAAPTAGVRR